MADQEFFRIWQTYKIPTLLGGVSLLCIAISLTLLFKSYQTASPIGFSSPAEVSTEAGTLGATSNLTIDIEGAVVRPGVYQLPAGSRVEDAIEASGGLGSDADSARIAGSINRAAKLSDGAKLYIPKKGDSAPSVGDLSNLSALGNLININSASQSQLEALAGVGPVTAKKIMGGRPYQTLEELVSKKAIGQALFDKLKDQLSL